MAIPRVDWLADLIRNECGVWLVIGRHQGATLDTLLCLSRLDLLASLATWSSFPQGSSFSWSLVCWHLDLIESSSYLSIRAVWQPFFPHLGGCHSSAPNLWVLVACYLKQGTGSLFFPIWGAV
jgi:hypothetical protein